MLLGVVDAIRNAYTGGILTHKKVFKAINHIVYEIIIKHTPQMGDTYVC